MRTYATKSLKVNIDSHDWARLAAFIDGEGCISIVRNSGVRRKNGHQLVLALHVGGTDPRLATWIYETFGVGTLYARDTAQRANPKWRMFFGWKVTGANAEALLGGCYLYLLLKKEQADVAFAFRKLTRVKGCARTLSNENFLSRELLKIKLEAIKHKSLVEV